MEHGNDLFTVDVLALASDWDKDHISPPDPWSLKHSDLVKLLRTLVQRFPFAAQLERAGLSAEGREILLLRLGTGSRRILLWSQMHGDEPTATNAVLDLVHYFGRHGDEPWVAEAFEKFTLLFIPMLNPDGAERGQRRNAQGIDINRDARMLQSPEGRLLKSLRDRYNPVLGFNLHNQNILTTVGVTGQVATIALLAVAADPPCSASGTGGGTAAQGRQLARQITAVLFEALSPFVRKHISRYDETSNPRAFGDNLTSWGTPVVLIESGGNPAGQPPDFGVKLNFVGLLAVLNSLATGKHRNADPATIDALMTNGETPIYDLMLRNTWICTGTGVPLFKGDIAIRHELRGEETNHAIIADMGDLGVFNAHEIVDCAGMMVSPGLIAWDPGEPILAARKADREYLNRGIVTVLESADWLSIESRRPEPEKWVAAKRAVNWGYVVSGAASMMDADQKLMMADWLAAGARAWIVDTAQADGQIMRWFGVQAIPREDAAAHRVPEGLRGDPASVLPKWTSKAAMRFDLPKRGVISVGAIPDLVLWKVPSADNAPSELGDCVPIRVILNGRFIDRENPRGAFLGRQSQNQALAHR